MRTEIKTVPSTWYIFNVQGCTQTDFSICALYRYWLSASGTSEYFFEKSEELLLVVLSLTCLVTTQTHTHQQKGPCLPHDLCPSYLQPTQPFFSIAITAKTPFLNLFYLFFYFFITQLPKIRENLFQEPWKNFTIDPIQIFNSCIDNLANAAQKPRITSLSQVDCWEKCSFPKRSKFVKKKKKSWGSVPASVRCHGSKRK